MIEDSEYTDLIARATRVDPLAVKKLLAFSLVSRFHGEGAAHRAAADYERVYATGGLPANIPEHTVATEGASLWVAKALSAAGLVKSTGEGKRLVEQGGVDVDSIRVTDAQMKLGVGVRYLLRAGSKNRRFAYVTVVSKM